MKTAQHMIGTMIGLFGLIFLAAVFTLSSGVAASAAVSVKVTPPARTLSCDTGAEVHYNVNVKNITGKTGLSVRFEPGGTVPPGVSAMFDDQILKPPGNGSTADTRLRITRGGEAAAENYTLTITADSGGEKATDTVTLALGECTNSCDFNLTASPGTQTVYRGEQTTYEIYFDDERDRTADSSTTIQLSVRGLPGNTSSTFSSAMPGQTGPSILTIETTADTPAGDYRLTITGQCGGVVKTSEVNLFVWEKPPEPGDFSLSANPKKIKAKNGANEKSEISALFTGGCEGPVNLTVDAGSLPPGLTASLKGKTVSKANPGQIVKFTVGENVPARDYNITITGKGCDKDNSVSIQLTVEEDPPEAGDFSLSVNPETFKAKNGKKYESKISALFTDGCEGPVNLTLDAGSLPPGLTASLNGKTVSKTNPGQIVKFTVGENVPARDYNITITGKGCDMEDEITMTVLVEAPRLEIVKRQSYAFVVPGQIQKYTITVTNKGDLPATQVMVRDELESNLEFVRHTASGRHSSIERNHSFSLAEELGPGDTKSFQIHAKVNDTLKAGVTVSNTARVTAGEMPVPEASNTVSAITAYTPVEANALDVKKSLAGGRPKVGGILVYRIRVKNRSRDGRVFDISIDNRLPNGFKYVEGSSFLDGNNIADPGGSRRMVWENMGDLSAGKSFTLKYRVVVGVNAGSGRNKNCADVKGADGGGNEVAGSDCAMAYLGAGDIRETGRITAAAWYDNDGGKTLNAADTPVDEAGFILVPPGLKQAAGENGPAVFEDLKPGVYVVGIDPRYVPGKYGVNGVETMQVRLIEGEHAEVVFLLSLSGDLIVNVGSRWVPLGGLRVSRAAEKKRPVITPPPVPVPAVKPPPPVEPLEPVSETLSPEAAIPSGEDGTKITMKPADSSAIIPVFENDTVRGRIHEWAAAWTGRDLDGYFSSYAGGFAPEETMPHDRWKTLRTSRIANKKSIEITIDRLRVDIDEDTAMARFKQHYRSDTYEDVVEKQLVLKKIGNDWKIAGETVLN